jgi:hypothetical protein
MSTILVGVLSAVAGALVTTILKWPIRLWTYLRTHLPPDHSSLYGPGWALTTTTSGCDRIRVQVVAAPDRSLPAAPIDPDRAIRFVHERFPGRFPPSPAFSIPSEGVRFDISLAGINEGYIWVWRSGRVDLDHYIVPNHDEQGRVIVPVLEILDQIKQVFDAMTSPAYKVVFPRRGIRRSRRFDWFIGVSPSITRPDGVTTSWNDVEFPGRRPSRAGTYQQAFCPPGGFAQGALRSWPSRRGYTALLQIFLLDFLHQNGFHDCGGAIDDTLAAFSQSSTPCDSLRLSGGCA